jgi:hypothetical protein
VIPVQLFIPYAADHQINEPIFVYIANHLTVASNIRVYPCGLKSSRLPATATDKIDE